MFPYFEMKTLQCEVPFFTLNKGNCLILNKGNTPLHTATRSGSIDVVQLLLESNADSNATNHRGSTPIHICSFLADLATQDDSCPDNYYKICFLLIKFGAIVDVADSNGYTPLHIASQRGANHIVTLLLSNDANTKAKTNVDSRGRGGRTPSEMAVFTGNLHTQKLIEDFTKSSQTANQNGKHIHITTVAGVKVPAKVQPNPTMKYK